ncbi:sialate O-acetylesterase [Lacipirellula sp.]|uniref:sialate O-acetylesterase n=1 Tax=Lacipirellula sp. TaxID=2691419 RepID=UPI003D09C4C0
MRRLLFSFLCVLVASSAYGQTPIDVYIFAGQSNMTGYLGGQGGLPAGTLNPNPNVLYSYKVTGPVSGQIYDSTSLVPLSTVLSTGSSEMTFGQEMYERTGKKIAVIKVAANATSLHYDWNIHSENLWYDALVSKVTSTKDLLASAGYAPNFAGMFWTQGEGDAATNWQSVVYQQNLTDFIQTLRTDINVEVPFYLNQLHGGGVRPYIGAIRTAQNNVVATVPNTRILNIDDLTLLGDGIHFTTETHNEVGRRWADLVYPSGDFNYDNVVNDLDLAIWKSTVGTTDMRGDGNSDNVVDGSDFLLWQRQNAAPPAPIAAVPEPASAVLALASVAALGLFRRPSRARS